MSRVESIKAEIRDLSHDDFARLHEWFIDRTWDHWDEQIESDVAAGKLDHLRDEATAAKRQGELRDL